MKKYLLAIALLSSIALCVACDDDNSEEKGATCSPDLFKASCADETHIYQCQDGDIVSVQCGANEVCSNNACKAESSKPSTGSDESGKQGEDKKSPTSSEGDKCGADFVASCDAAGNLVTCIDGEVSVEACSNGEYCLLGKCQGSCEQGSDFCLDEKTVMMCISGKYYKGNCSDGCANNRCVNPNEQLGGDDEPEGPACELGTKPYCDEDGTLVSCEYWGEPMVVKSQCVSGTKCQDGVCVMENADRCVGNVCKDFHTLLKCEDGVATESKCGEGEVCLSEQCKKMSGVDFCENDDECADDEVCRDSLCYKKAQFDIKIGSACDSGTFQEYCENGMEVKCDPYEDFVVTKNSCEGYNGCSMIVQKAYNPDPKATPKLIRNAICRGTDSDLAYCSQHMGVVYNSCLNVEGVGIMSGFSYSYTNACIYGTDGQPVFSFARDQTSCTGLCDDSTGLCE